MTYKSFEYPRGPVIIYVEDGRVKRRGIKGVLDWLEGGANFFFKQLIGDHQFLGFARSLVCAFANGITFTK